MKRLIGSFLAATTMLFLGTSAYAQKGHPGGGAGPASGMGASHSDASSHSGNGNGASVNGGQKAPDQLLSQNTKLSDNLGKLLPTGITPQQACQNFKNLGQCVAAIHVSKNLGIDFNSLACDMTLKPVVGTACPANTATGSKGMSLGASIEALKPGTNGKSESKSAMKQANQDIKESGS